MCEKHSLALISVQGKKELVEKKKKAFSLNIKYCDLKT